MYGLIAGTGFDKVLNIDRTMEVTTPYGQALVCKLKLGRQDLYYLPRHGPNHHLPPHKINYRANCWALKDLGVDHILSLCAVGSLNKDYHPGDLVLLKDLIDFTKSRVGTYFDGDSEEVRHLDVSEIYNKEINRCLKGLGEKQGLPFKEGVYLATEGPRFETAAEVQFFASTGADLVGMTGAPEVFLANELSMTYNSLAYVINYATGLVEGEVELSSRFEEVSPLILAMLEDLMKQEGIGQKRAKFL